MQIQTTGLDLSGLSYSELRLYALEGLVYRAFSLPDSECMILRGSFVTRTWVRPHFREVRDLDFVAAFPLDAERGHDFVRRMLKQGNGRDGLTFFSEQLRIEPTWADSEYPGYRYFIPIQVAGQSLEIQLDLAYNDPLLPGPVWMSYPAQGIRDNFMIHTIRPELALAWKVHGLFEFWESKKGAWRIKDLYDIWLLIQTQELEMETFQAALELAFVDRKTPFSVMKRLMEGQFGLSKGSQRAWMKFVRENEGQVAVESHLGIVEQVREFLQPVVQGWV